MRTCPRGPAVAAGLGTFDLDPAAAGLSPPEPGGTRGPTPGCCSGAGALTSGRVGRSSRSGRISGLAAKSPSGEAAGAVDDSAAVSTGKAPSTYTASPSGKVRGTDSRASASATAATSSNPSPAAPAAISPSGPASTAAIRRRRVGRTSPSPSVPDGSAAASEPSSTPATTASAVASSWPVATRRRRAGFLLLRVGTGPAASTASLMILAKLAPVARLSFSKRARALLATPARRAADPVGTGSFADRRKATRSLDGTPSSLARSLTVNVHLRAIWAVGRSVPKGVLRSPGLRKVGSRPL